ESDYSNYLSNGVDVYRTYVNEWYTGRLRDIFFNDEVNPVFRKQITSVLAGYVWDDSNPFVSKHKNIINHLSHIINMK
nr:pyridine nucleotide-disulfide oxidoreductase [Pelagibacterales bacterium]